MVVTGGVGDDVITGSSQDDVIDAGAGNDVVDGGQGRDPSIGGLGADRIKVGDGAGDLGSIPIASSTVYDAAALRDILLRAEAAPTSSTRGPARFIDLLGDFGEEAHFLYLKYYADEQWRSQWAEEFPLDQIPEKEPPPYDRDRHLPKP